jgi:rfaE bifunctional protein kinase chain/domain
MFDNRKILIVGDVMIDTYLFGNVDRISPEAPVPVVDVIIKQDKLGGAANVAMNIKELGGTPFLCSVIGSDTKCDTMFNILSTNKISTKYISKVPTRITTNKTRIIGNNQQMLRVDEEIIENLNTNEFILLKNDIEKVLKNEDIEVILIQDYDKGIVNADIINLLTKKAKELKIPILADPKNKNFNDYKNLTLFKPNFKEFKEGLNISATYRKELLEIGSQLLHKKGIKYIFVTLSENGIFISEKKGKKITNKIVHGISRSVSDPSGAGDTVIAITSLLIEKEPIEKIAQICNIAGGLVCEEIGVVPVDKDKLFEEMKNL